MFCVRRDDRARRNLHGAKDIQERSVPLDNAKVWPVRHYKGSERDRMNENDAASLADLPKGNTELQRTVRYMVAGIVRNLHDVDGYTYRDIAVALKGELAEWGEPI